MRNDPERFREKPEIEDILHYGVKRRSGRYPWGSGDSPYQHSGDFISRVDEIKKRTGVTKESELIELVNEDMGLKMSSKEWRIAYKIANNDRRKLLAARAKSLREDGLTLDQIAAEMGYNNDSSVRQLLNESIGARKAGGEQTADLFRDQIGQKGMIDVGEGVEKQLGISRGQVEDAIYRLGLEGYNVYGVSVPQATNPKNRTTVEVLADKDIPYVYAVNHKDQIQPVDEFYSHDGGETFVKLQYPASLSSDRVAVRYGDEGGKDKDGVIEIRRGVEDLSLGNSNYAQVRILVDGDKYLKGMAMYSDDIPEGYDVLFNTNKVSGTPKGDVMKATKANPNDPLNPFGATIKANGQVYYTDKDGNQKLGVVNKIKEEGEWDDMSRNLSSQFLSKQPLKLAKQQLKLTYDERAAELDEIMSLENPTVKRKYLLDFADECDSAAVHMKAAALPRQRVQVILPLTKIKDDEVYAPNFENGETLALVRYPHGGTFEIPIVKVNNNNPDSKRILGKAKDAIGISAKTAERLSGADFDGDTVVAIPVNDRSPVKSTPPLRALKDFDPKTEYATVADKNKEGYGISVATGKSVKLMQETQKQRQMGTVSNLITDMTLKGAPEEDIAKAVKHSMVVIDAVKHKLDYKQSEVDNDIATLKERWQGGGGASTLLSRRKQDVEVPERRGSAHINPETGELEYNLSGRTYTTTKTYKRTGETVVTEHQAKSKEKLVLNTKDVRSLSSGTEMENTYADYCNQMKALANRARKEYTTAGRLKYNPKAAKEYEPEVKSLTAQLNLCKANAPLERRAQILANARIEAQKRDNPGMDKSDLKKFRDRAIKEARAKVGTLKGRGTHIKISDRQWEAIQKGAVSDNLLTQIMRYTDQDALRKRAMPKQTVGLSVAQQNRLKSMLASGYSQQEIAKAMNISASTVSEYSGT